jgi:hypothetical protein
MGSMSIALLIMYVGVGNITTHQVLDKQTEVVKNMVSGGN